MKSQFEKILFFLVLFAQFSYSQKINNGVYIGFEQNPFCYTKHCLIDYTKNKLNKGQIYYRIKLEVYNNKTILSKIPVIYINKKKQIVDSLKGGYYVYEIEQSSKGIFGKLIDNKFTNFKHSCAVPYYIMEYYTYRITDKGLIISNETNKNILLRKIK